MLIKYIFILKNRSNVMLEVRKEAGLHNGVYVKIIYFSFAIISAQKLKRFM